jgi:anti-anti-sigma factor
MARAADVAWYFSVESLKSDDGRLVLKLAGRLGMASAGELGENIERACTAGNRQIVLDLSGLDYISSAGVGAIGRAADRLAGAGGALMLTRPHGALKVALDLAGAIRHTTYVESRS